MAYKIIFSSLFLVTIYLVEAHPYKNYKRALEPRVIVNFESDKLQKIDPSEIDITELESKRKNEVIPKGLFEYTAFISNRNSQLTSSSTPYKEKIMFNEPNAMSRKPLSFLRYNRRFPQNTKMSTTQTPSFSNSEPELKKTDEKSVSIPQSVSNSQKIEESTINSLNPIENEPDYAFHSLLQVPNRKSCPGEMKRNHEGRCVTLVRNFKRRIDTKKINITTTTTTTTSTSTSSPIALNLNSTPSLLS